MAAVAVDQRADARRSQTGDEQPNEKPPMVSVADQPRAAAISGTVSTGG
jgi:hypothetical protein